MNLQLSLPHLSVETRDVRIAGQPIVDRYLLPRPAQVVNVLGGKYAGDTLIYLLHFERPYHHCRHYIGCTNDLERRLRQHQRKYPSFEWRGKRYRRYATFYKALARDIPPEEIAARKFELSHQARRDNGVSLLMAVNRAGIPWHVAAVWQADRTFETYLKRRKESARFCPVCQGDDRPF